MINKQILKFSTLGLIAAAMTVAPISASAADTNKPAMKPAKENAAAPKVKTIPFRGPLAAVDKVKMTITVGTRTFDITSETKITRDGKPAIIGDAVVGDTVGGAYKSVENGKLTATTVNLTSKTGDKPVKKVKEKAADIPAM